MKAYTTHSLLEYARDFDLRLICKRCEFSIPTPTYEFKPYTIRHDYETCMGTVLCPSSLRGIYFSHSGFMPVLEVTTGEECEEDETKRDKSGVRYFVGEHCVLCADKDGFGFPLDKPIDNPYRDGIDMIEKVNHLTFTQPAITHLVFSIISFMLEKNEDGIAWLSDNGMRIFSRGLGVEVLWDGIDVEKETFSLFPIQALFYLCYGFDSFAMAQDDRQFVFRDMTECPRYIYVDKGVYTQKRFNHLHPDYFFDDAVFKLKTIGCFTVHIPECGTWRDVSGCDTVTICPQENGKLKIVFEDFKGNIVREVTCDVPCPTWFTKPVKTIHRQSRVCGVFMCGFDGMIGFAEDQEGTPYITIETTCKHPTESFHPLAAMTPEDKSVHVRIVANVKVLG